MMPGANGYEVFNALKNDATVSAIPLIFLSASVEKKAIEKGLNMGAMGYIQKPFDPQELFDMITICFE